MGARCLFFEPVGRPGPAAVAFGAPASRVKSCPVQAGKSAADPRGCDTPGATPVTESVATTAPPSSNGCCGRGRTPQRPCGGPTHCAGPARRPPTPGGGPSPRGRSGTPGQRASGPPRWATGPPHRPAARRGYPDGRCTVPGRRRSPGPVTVEWPHTFVLPGVGEDRAGSPSTSSGTRASARGREPSLSLESGGADPGRERSRAHVRRPDRPGRRARPVSRWRAPVPAPAAAAVPGPARRSASSTASSGGGR